MWGKGIMCKAFEGMTPLDWFNYYKKKLKASHQTIRPNGFDIVETALKDYETLVEVHSITINSMKPAEQAIKSLEIIKKKGVDVFYFMNCKTLEDYNDDLLASYGYEKSDAEERMLNQEEFNLLKKVL